MQRFRSGTHDIACTHVHQEKLFALQAFLCMLQASTGVQFCSATCAYCSKSVLAAEQALSMQNVHADPSSWG